MKASSPPPTIPSRMRGSAIVAYPYRLFRCSGKAQRPPDLRLVACAAREVVKGSVGDADDLVADEGRAFARAVLRVLQAAFPLQHGPVGEAVLGELAEVESASTRIRLSGSAAIPAHLRLLLPRDEGGGNASAMSAWPVAASIVAQRFSRSVRSRVLDSQQFDHRIRESPYAHQCFACSRPHHAFISMMASA